MRRLIDSPEIEYRVIQNLGLFIIVEEVHLHLSPHKVYEGLIFEEIKSRFILPNPNHRHYCEEWEWDRLDRKQWSETNEADRLEKLYWNSLPKQKK